MTALQRLEAARENSGVSPTYVRDGNAMTTKSDKRLWREYEEGYDFGTCGCCPADATLLSFRGKHYCSARCLNKARKES